MNLYNYILIIQSNNKIIKIIMEIILQRFVYTNNDFCTKVLRKYLEYLNAGAPFLIIFENV